MLVERLSKEHAESIKPLFSSEKYMGVDSTESYFVPSEITLNEMAYNVFCDTYLSGLSNFVAYGSVENNVVTSAIAFYEDVDSPAWYWTHIRSINRKHIPAVLDAAVKHNENHGRLKFYSMFNSKYAKSYRRLTFSDDVNSRYDFTDECFVPAKTKCIYRDYWQILYNRTLLPVDSIIRVTFLKQEHRLDLPISGAI